MIDRRLDGFRELCLSAYTLSWAGRADDLANRFLLCRDENEFRGLCRWFQEWGGDNPIGDELLSRLRDIKEVERVSEILLDNPEGI